MNIPRHIGIIMDGNGRWAKKRGLPRVMGHRAGTDATREIVRCSGELGLEYLTIYVFSAENWNRPRKEIGMLMDLLVEIIKKEVENLNENNVKLTTIGDISKLPRRTLKELKKGIDSTRNNTGLNLVLALSYGGRDEIVKAAVSLALEALKNPSVLEGMNESRFSKYLYTSDIPDPELVIRTGGEQRVSNFLLWQAAYSELYLTDVLWPEFNRDCLVEAIKDFNKRERRFGKVKDS